MTERTLRNFIYWTLRKAVAPYGFTVRRLQIGRGLIVDAEGHRFLLLVSKEEE